jgi:chromosome segregation ATPase
MLPQQWPLPAELGLDANDPFYSLYTILYESYQASLTATTALENDLHILRRTNSELIAKLENKESQIKLLEKFTKTQRSAEQEREEALEELRKTNLAKKEIQEQLVNFAKRNVILLNEITQKNKENHQLFVKFENEDYALEELEELRKEVKVAKNLAMEKQDELENLRRTLSTALFRRVSDVVLFFFSDSW